MSRILNPLASLRLTVVLMLAALVLVFVGTIAQVNQGIHEVVNGYFRTLLIWVHVRPFQAGGREIPLPTFDFPVPGGYVIGGLLLVNLLAAHAIRFKLSWKRAGVILIHVGIILLLVGELITGLFAVEANMSIDEGSASNYAESTRLVELAIVDPSDAKTDSVIAVPGSMLRPGRVVRDSRLPFDIQTVRYMPNSQAFGPVQARQMGVTGESLATAGMGKGVIAVEIPPVSGTEEQVIDVPAAFVTLSRNNQSLGTYLVTLWFESPQPVQVGDKTYLVELRFKRYYKPYTLRLFDFKHDKFTGTDIPRNFSSHVRLIDPTQNEDREVVISMNNPLRYKGETFYQAAFKNNDKTTVLQVVKNPGWLMPYIACTIGALGMVAHFGMNLVTFLRRRVSPSPTGRAWPRTRGRVRGSADERGVDSLGVPSHPMAASPPPPPSPGGRGSYALAVIAVALGIAYVAVALRPPAQTSDFDLQTFGRLPVSHNGRVKPVETVARTNLMMLRGRHTLRHEGKTIPATQWLLDAVARPQVARDYRVFRIDHPDIVGQLGLPAMEKFFTFAELEKNGELIMKQAQAAFNLKQRDRTLYQRKILELANRIMAYNRLASLETPYVVAPLNAGEDWRQLHEVAKHAGHAPASHPSVVAFGRMIQAYAQNKPHDFRDALSSYTGLLDAQMPGDMAKARHESLYQRAEPFYRASVLYVIVFVLVCVSWLRWSGPLATSARWLLLATLLTHTIGLVARMYLEGRPPVTNLYSSAIFVGWGCVILGLVIEWIFRNSVGTIVAAVTGFLTLVLAHNLDTGGDTMEMMRAVLDSNFWLATHVVVITIGYASTFLAGFLGILYILRGVFTASLPPEAAKNLSRAIYGILCFATLMSFVGTILGGIWADQSWGRFWGWDPKENGALIIVLWNAVVLHARWSGLAQQRGVAVLSVFGNIVTSWSWFGVNMLGVGLHSYGFMDSALFWLGMFVLSQLVIMALGVIPLGYWRSFEQPFPDTRGDESLPGATARAVPATPLPQK